MTDNNPATPGTRASRLSDAFRAAVKRQQQEQASALRTAGLHQLEAEPLIASVAVGSASEPVHFETWAELKARLPEPQVYASGADPSDSLAFIPPSSSEKSGRERVWACATVVAWSAAVLLAFVLGYVLGAGYAPTALPQPPRTHVTQARYAQPDAPASGEMISS